MIYLDHAATTPVDAEILQTYTALLQDYFANPSSIHHLGRDAGFLLEKARKQCLSLFKTPNHQLIFTSGATEANNLAIKGIALGYQNRGKHLITSASEHPSVLESFIQLRDYFGFELTILPIDVHGTIRIEDLKNALRKDTILVSIMHVNNETGSINPLEQIASLLQKFPKTFFHSDVTQSIGKITIPFCLLDAFSFSSHKIHGLKGSGALVLKKSIVPLPLLSGGGQEDGLRSGTENFASDILLAKTLRLAFDRQIHFKGAIEELSQHLRSSLELIPTVVMNSPRDAIPHIINLSLIKHKASIILEALSKKQIFLASIAACSSKGEKHSKTVEVMFDDLDRASNTLRISLSHLNTKEEIDIFLTELKFLLKEVKPR